MIRIGIVDDHQIVIDGLKLLLGKHPGFKVVAEATSGSQMLEHLEHSAPPDVLLMDLLMPEMDGYTLATTVSKSYPAIKIIALSMNCDGAEINRLIDEAGISGYILKTANKTELKKAIESVKENLDYFSDEVLKELRLYQKIKEKNAAVHLTARELEIVRCITSGLTNKVIATRLFISEYTVETHRKNIFRKTNTRSALSLTEYARNHKLI